MVKLAIAQDLSLPLEAVTEKIGFLGRTGGGKSYAAQKLAEEFHAAGAQFVALDPVGIWWGLRLAKNGKDAGIAIPVLGGLRGDVPLEPSAGKVVADLVVDKGTSVVIDVSQFESDADKARFATDFAARFFFRKKASPSPVHVFIEEAQEFCVSEDTEVLTKQGWRPIASLHPGRTVVAFDVESGAFSYEPVERVISLPFSGDLVHLHTTSIDCAVTPDHRVVMRRFQHDPVRYKLYPWTHCEAAALPKGFQVPSGGAPMPAGDGVEVADDMIRLLGWIITDGYFHQRSKSRLLALQQSRATVKLGSTVADEMEVVLRRLGGRSQYERPSRTTRTPHGMVVASPSVQFYLGAELSRNVRTFLGDDIHRIPRSLLEHGTRKQLEILYTGLLEGDGTAKNGRWSRFYAGLNEPLADDFQELATRLGVRTIKKKVPQNGQWIVCLSESKNHWVRGGAKSLPYSGTVWCLTVPSGAFVARRNGTVFVTGNCPQNAQRGEERMLHAFHRMIKLGRNFGIGASLISQRPQEVNKKVLNQTELLFAFQLTGPQERKAVEGWIAEKGVDEDIAGELPKLKRGHPHAWSPAWLQISRVVAIAEKWTFDASSTPKVGDAKKVRELGQIDIDQLGAEIQASVQRAKADDPKELKKLVAERDRQIAQMRKAPSVTIAKPVVDQAVVQSAVDKAVASERAWAVREIRSVHSKLAKLLTPLTGLADAIGDVAQLANTIADKVSPPASPDVWRTASGRQSTVPPAASHPEPRQSTHQLNGNGEGVVSRPQMRMLQALASFEALGVNELAKSHVGVFSNQSPTSSGLDKNFSTLRTAGLIEYLSESRVRLTDGGRGVAGPVEAPASLRDLHEAWYAKISGPQEKMLRILIDVYPEDVEKDALATGTDQSPTSSGFDKNCSTLRSLGLADYAPGKRIHATELLFPEGLS